MKITCLYFLITYKVFVSAQTLYEKQIIPFDAMNTDHFGADIAINDSLLFISSLRYSNSIDACVYVYKLIDSDFVFENKIYPNDPEPLALFGSKLHYQDGQLFVGARNKKVNTFRTGALYVFEFENNNWVQKQMIIPPEPLLSQQYFSESIAKLNETLVIGAYRSNAGAEDNGKVFIYKYLNNQYTLQQELAPYDPKDFQFFGNSLILKNNFLLVGSYGDSTASGPESGSIYSYLKEDTVFIFSRKYIPQPNPPYLTLGTSMTSNDDYVFAGSAASFSYNLPGKVYIYKITESLIEFNQIIESGEGYSNDRFGINMQVKGDTLLVSAFFDSVNSSNPGSVYLFVNENSNWTKKKKIVPTDEQTASLFGNSLEINDRIFFVGASLSSINEINPGKVYLFSSTPLSSFDDEPNLVNEFVLYPNYPNPFNSKTTIWYSLPSNGDVNIKIFNVLGQEVNSILLGYKTQGFHTFSIDFSGISSGVYFIRTEYLYEFNNKIYKTALTKKAVLIN